MEDTEALQETLYNEMVARIKEDDESVPARKGDYLYYTRTEKGKNYTIHCRKQGNLHADEEILLDENVLAQEYDYFSLGVFSISPDHNTLAYSVDTSGSERFELRFKDLRSGDDLSETIDDTSYSFAWGNDNQTVFYTRVDAANRPYKLFRHSLGADPSKDELVHHEEDDAFFMSVDKTRNERFILLHLGSKVTDETHFLDADDPTGGFSVVEPRRQDVEYFVDHHGEHFYIVTNENATNFKVMRAPVSAPAAQNWEELIPHREDVTITSLDTFAGHLIVEQRENGLPTLVVRNLSTGDSHKIEMDEPTYDVWVGENPEFETETLRFDYSSLVTPMSVFDYNMNTRERALKKETEVFGYDRAKYEALRIYATGHDGAKIPVSLVRGKNALAGPNPVLLMGYGSYGFSYPVGFRSVHVSLLDRGMTIAVAHIRGGGEMGRGWYENGKYLEKKNTFTDFVDCAQHLVDAGYTTPEQLAIVGRSAGGLLMGAVTNMRPDLFNVVVADVPFVDVLSTILDETLPLTVVEWEEWGNPNQEDYYNYMKSYSPYDNVEAKVYPTMLVTGGLNDPRVSYWEPAKWTAKLRELKTDDNVLLLKTNMGAGHAGVSGRYEQFKEVAFEYAFILKHLRLM